MRVYLFGNESCDKCKAMQRHLLKANVSYFYFDADDPNKQDWYDSLGVDHLPHIQIRSSTDEMLYDFPGCSDPRIVTAALGKAKLKK